jgi:hypothetical protein
MSSLEVNPEQALGLAAGLADQVGACVRAPWRVLAVVSSEGTLSAMWLAEAVGHACGAPGTALVFNADGLSREGVLEGVEKISAFVKAGGRAVVALDALMARRSGAPLLTLADGALLAVQLGVSTLKGARRAVDLIGRERFLGAVTLQASRPWQFA